MSEFVALFSRKCIDAYLCYNGIFLECQVGIVPLDDEDTGYNHQIIVLQWRSEEIETQRVRQ